MKRSTILTIALSTVFCVQSYGAFVVQQIRLVGNGYSAIDDHDINNTGEAFQIWEQIPIMGAIPLQPAPLAGVTSTYFLDVAYRGRLDEVNVGSGGGNFAGNDLPAGPGTGGDDWSVRVFSKITLPAGDYTIGFGSDDGGFLQIPGITFTETTADPGFDRLAWNGTTAGNGGGPGNTANSPAAINAGSDSLWYGNGRGHGWTIGTFTVATELETTITSFFSERGGGDSFELAVLNSHSLNRGGNNDSSDDDIILGEGWQLLSDGVFGITLEAPGPIPEPTTSMSMMFAVGVLALLRRLKSEFDSRKWNA